MSAQIIRQMGLEDLRQSKAPGLYSYESFGLPQREFFSTGVPAFVGTLSHPIPAITQDSLPRPRMLSLWSQFETHIGKPDGKSRLAYAVRGFFENGGHWCYVTVLKDRSQAQLAAGLEAIGNLNTIDLVCVPDLPAAGAEEQQQMVVDHCQDMGNRFAILDSGQGDQPLDIAARWSAIDGNNGALYYPWVRIHGFNGGLETMPPCGHIAGVFNRVDRDRGSHKAPANEVLNGVVGLERPISGADQDLLNPRGVNCLRAFPGRGIRIWGARTLSAQRNWTYVNVRRIFLTAARWLDWNMIDLDFEPNDARLWATVERRLTEYFYDLYKRGALKGDSIREAFFVKCNEETNPPEQREAGEMAAEIGLATAVPFEFVVVRLIRGARGARLSGDSTIHATA